MNKQCQLLLFIILIISIITRVTVCAALGRLWIPGPLILTAFFFLILKYKWKNNVVSVN